MTVGLAGSIPIVLLKILFTYKYLKSVGVIFCISINAICLYIALVKSALLDV